MKVLLIHTKYKERGGEDIVVENELQLMEQMGYITQTLYFDNSYHHFLNLLMLPFNIASYYKTIKKIKQFKPDIAHLHNLHFTASPSVVWALKHKKIPIVKTLHNYRLLCPSGILYFKNNLFFNSLHEPFPWTSVFKRVYRRSALLTFWLAFSIWFNKFIGTWKLIDKYIVFTEKNKQFFLSSNLDINNDQLVVKSNFVNPQPPTTSVRNEHFLYVGRLSEEKGISTLVNTFSNNKLPLTIIGDGPLSVKIKKLISKNPLVKWLGYQPSEIITAELKKCSALIVPSVCFEGMPIIIIEAFANATPIISSRLGAMEDMVEPEINGLFFEAGNAVNLNNQLGYWNDMTAEKRNKISIAAYHTYEKKYTPDKNLLLLQSIYLSVTDKK